jgi:putative glycosyltransferase (TIGR04348 family)
MQILIVYPAVIGIKNGNLITAKRWQECLGHLGHTVEVATTFDNVSATPDLMIALHAIKSSNAIHKCRAVFPAVPIIVVLTGTDIYGTTKSATIDAVLALSDRIVVLQNATAKDVDQKFRDKVRVIYQAITPLSGVFEKSKNDFEVCVVGHLRPVKDPFRTADAISDLPGDSKIRVTQIGAAMSEPMREMAERLGRENVRFRWIKGVPRTRAMEKIASSHLLVNSSKIEGGAAVICEAIVAGTPILATRIPGNVGFLGEDYEGFFDVGATEQLRTLLLLSENSADFYQRLKDQCGRRSGLFDPDFEKTKWADLIEEFES